MLQTEDGAIYKGTREIFRYLQTRDPWEHADAHRRQFEAHREARVGDAPGQLVERFHRPEPTETADKAFVVHVPEKSRYEIRVGEDTIGLAEYRRDGDALVFTHTEVDPEHRNEGLASQLVGSALEDARTHGHRIVPVCAFVAAYVKRHPEYAA